VCSGDVDVNADGSFGDTTGLGKTIISYSYEMETRASVASPNEVMRSLKAEFANILICADQSIISGIKHQQNPPKSNCVIQLEEVSGACYNIAGQLSLFASGEGSLKDVDAEGTIQDAIGNGHFLEKVDGITRLSLKIETLVTSQEIVPSGKESIGFSLLGVASVLFIGGYIA